MVDLDGALGHESIVKQLKDRLPALAAHLLTAQGVIPQLHEGPHQVLRLVGGKEQTTAGGGQQFRERAMIGLHHRCSVGQGLQDEETLGLVVGRGHGKDIDVAEKFRSSSITRRWMPNWSIVPVHIMHGLSVVYMVTRE